MVDVKLAAVISLWNIYCNFEHLAEFFHWNTGWAFFIGGVIKASACNTGHPSPVVFIIDVKNVFTFFYYFYYNPRFSTFFILSTFFYFLVTKMFNPTKPAKLLHQTNFKW